MQFTFKYKNKNISNKQKYKSKNKFIFNLNTVDIIVISKEKEYKFIIDIEDFDKIKNHTFYLAKGNYAYCTIHGNYKTSLHRIILDVVNKEKDKDVDHINHDTFDNRKSNLRIVTRKENSLNRKGYKNGHNGVYYHKRDDRWRVSLKINGKNYYKTCYTYEDACEYADSLINSLR